MGWGDITALLWNGYDPRWAKSEPNAVKAINQGTYGDVLTVFESFPYLIWNLMEDKKITVTDNPPRPSLKALKIHKNLFCYLQYYAGAIGEGYQARIAAWEKVYQCLDLNGFFQEDNAKVICKTVYDDLTDFVSRGAWEKVNALILAKVHQGMRYTEEGKGFCKRGNASIPALEFASQIWLMKSDSTDPEEVKIVKRQRGVNAIIRMGGGETPPTPLPQWSRFEIPYYLAKGTMVKLQKAVEPGGMLCFQSSSWDWRTAQKGDSTDLGLLNDAGDHLLNISLRQGDNVIILNSRYASGSWGAEEKIRLRDSFVASNFSISVCHRGDRYEILFSYQPAIYYTKRIDGVISGVSYTVNGTYSPLSEELIVSAFDTMEQLARTNHLANCETPGCHYAEPNTRTITTRPAFKRGANFAAAPGKKKKDRLGKYPVTDGPRCIGVQCSVLTPDTFTRF